LTPVIIYITALVFGMFFSSGFYFPPNPGLGRLHYTVCWSQTNGKQLMQLKRPVQYLQTPFILSVSLYLIVIHVYL